MSNAILLAALVVGIDPHLLSAICYVESGHNVNAYVHNDGGSPSYGQCQIKMATAKDMGFRGTKKELMSEGANALYAAKYLNYQYKRTRRWESAIIAYNAGRVIKSQKYLHKVKKVMGEKKWTALQNAHVETRVSRKSSPPLISITAQLAKLK
jgi:soluble lytic murein transglycosylase-like protein